VPITNFQSDVLRLLAAQRSHDSDIAGGVAINRDGPRISADIDIDLQSEMADKGAAEHEAEHEAEREDGRLGVRAPRRTAPWRS
jgi:hypothetical protein